MNYKIIQTGSKGNCTIVENILMLDCGLPYKRIESYLKQIKLIFISHIHGDHINKATIKKIGFNYPNIKFVVGSKDLVEKLVIECQIFKDNVFILESGKWYDLGLLKVKLDSVFHDVPNNACHFEINNKKGIYIIDTKKVDLVAKDYDLYLIEANYQKEILEKHKKELDENYEYDHLYRVEEAHLSYEQAIDWLIANMGNKSEYEMLHLSDYNFEKEK